MNTGLIIVLIVAAVMVVIGVAAAAAFKMAGIIMKEFEEWRG